MNATTSRAAPRTAEVRAQVSPAEWELRVDLAACYRLVALFGWDDLVFTHISARVPGPEHHFLINPYGMLFEEITASSLVKIDLGGRKVADSPVRHQPGRLHDPQRDPRRARGREVRAAHAQPERRGGVGAERRACCRCRSSRSSCCRRSPTTTTKGVALHDDEKPRLVRDLGDKNFLMLRNHGLLTVGETIADAFLFMYFFEAACTIQVRAQAGGGELISVDPRIVAGVKAAVREVTRSLGGGIAWPGLLRRLDRVNPGYGD